MTRVPSQPISKKRASQATLLTRLLIGLLVSGCGELLQRLDQLQAQKRSVFFGY